MKRQCFAATPIQVNRFAMVLVALSLFGILGHSAYAKDPVTDEQGFVSLFDSKTLDGWHINPERIGHGTGGKWYVENGAIVGEQDPPGSGNGGILLTDQKFGDFELLIDMNHDWGPCSGLFLRSNDRGQCYQIMVDYHDGGNVGHVYGEGTGGFIARGFDVNGTLDDSGQLNGFKAVNVRKPEEHGLKFTCTPDEWIRAWKIGDWNTMKVRCEGKYPQITTWINGVKVCEFDGDAYSNDRYDKEKIHQALGDEGSIAVQVHAGKGWPNGAKVRWKNIKIKPL